MSIHYNFPRFEHIDDVRKVIEGHPEFIEVQKEGGYTVINYVYSNGKDTFPTVECWEDAILRECRGLVFDTKSGMLVARRFHKFFNLGERDDLSVDWSQPHRILEKLDGSMISPIEIDGGIRWISKMGITSVSMQAETFVAGHNGPEDYLGFARHAIRLADMTAIFEWCSRKQRIVVDYPQDRLVLLALRWNRSGRYMKHHDMRTLARRFNIPVVSEVIALEQESTERQLEYVRCWDSAEGVVVQFDDGHMVKVKSSWYVGMHRAKSLIENERDIVGIILDDKLDDLKPILPAPDVERSESFAAGVRADIHSFARKVRGYILMLREDGVSRRAYATSEPWETGEECRPAIYSLWDTPKDRLLEGATEWAEKAIRRSLGSNKSYEERVVKGGIITTRWNPAT